MRKFEKKINELNLSKGNLSKSLNKNINDFDVLDQSLKGLRAEYREANSIEDNDDEIERLNGEIEELEGQLENFDEVLVDKVQNYADNYDSYQTRIKKMEEGRKAKAAAKVAPAAAPTPAPTPTNEPAPAPKVEPTPAPTNEPTQAPKVEEKEEKGTNWLLWGVLGVAGIFVGINLFKNKR